MARARDVMTTPVVGLEGSTPVLQAVARMAESRIGAIIICEDDTPIGIFTERDLLSCVASKKELELETATLSAFMTAQLFVAQADDDLDTIVEKMRYMQVRHVPVVERGRLVGMVSIRDLLNTPVRPASRIEVGSWMSERPLSVRRDHSLLDAARQMSARNVGAVLVLDDTGALCGICTERDLLTKVVAQEKNASALTVADVMTPHPTVVNVGDDFETVYDTLMQINARHLPVTDGAKLVGIVSLRDVFKVRERILERHLDEEKDLVRSYQQLLDRPQEARIAHLLYEKEQLKRLAVTDELTGLYNFRYFQKRLDEEFNRATRYGHELSVAICDLDDFKKINDTYGHPAGDEVLSRVGRMLGHSLDVVHVLVSLRLSDLVMRYGGEEFVVIFPETSLEDAHEAAERIRRAIAAYGFLPRKSEVPVHVTMSIGIASFPTHACRKEDLIQRADEALYQAKTAGKNLVVTYQNA